LAKLHIIEPTRIRSKIPSGEQHMSALTSAEVNAKLSTLADWKVANGELVRTFQFRDFRGSMAFVNQVADLAEAAGHHPDIDIRYNKVRLALVTHDAGGITAKDFDLAAQSNKLI
jgi:4a-hydroxytetrahydrobiopterin dehydratase